MIFRSPISAARCFITCVAFIPFILAGPSSAAEDAAIRIDASKPGARISSMLYGIFFEEINHAGDGGLYAELVRNGSFEEQENSSAAGWRAIGSAEASVQRERPLTQTSPGFLRVTIPGARGRSGVENGGYWGISVRRGETYRFTCFIRSLSGFAGPIRVSLDADGKSAAHAVIPHTTNSWKRVSLALKATQESRNARLSITTDAAATFDLEAVSLFPSTWKNRPNGLRPDLAEKLAEMKPAFVRFPGGCYVEGDRIQNAFRWKESLGPIHGRAGHLNDIWRYWSTDGLGYHEYLQLCEDLSAEPLFVVNCGMAHRDTIAMEQIDPWVQDALDAIEYARGPVSSRWGAVRARNGHPKPFRLNYLEIGNENGWGATLPAYDERYAKFYDAIKSKYPDVKLIANVPVKSRPVEILDDHYYMTPDWFRQNEDLYARTDRSGAKIYVGEYAVTTGGPGHGNLRAALGEAAFMLGMERNSDVVTMSSYAPLFVNVNDRRWNPNAICFDGSRSYGTPSYHVQSLFSRHRPDVNLATTVSLPPPAAALPKGTIGLGTWKTRAEYRDIRVMRNGQTVYQSDFGADAKSWRAGAGRWSVTDSAYRQDDLEDDRRSVLELPELAGAGDYTLELKARKMGGEEGFLVLFHTQSRNDFYWWNLGGWGNREHGIEKGSGGGKSQIAPHVPGRIETGRWYDIRIELQGARIRCFLDGKLVHDTEETPPKLFTALAGRLEKTGEIVLKAVNASAFAQKAGVTVDGAGGISAEGTQIVLSGEEADENSLDEPERIAPKVSRAVGLGKQFQYVFPARSVTILRIKPAR